MALYQLYLLSVTALLLQYTLLIQRTEALDEGQCLNSFSPRKEDFVLDMDESLKNGATVLSSPMQTSERECVVACCKDSNCNLAVMERGSQNPLVKSCLLFNCLYKQKKVCQFVKKKGFSSYVLTAVFGSYFEEYVPGEADLPPVANVGQDKVVQPNEVVILNGIESKDDHKIELYKWTLVSGKPTPVIEKSKNFEDQVTVSNLSAGVYKFRLTVTDNIGQTGTSDVTVLVLTPEQSLHHCLVPKKIGVCRGSFPRWHYNAASEQCEEFKYGGCKGNANNYLTKEECLDACDKVSVFNSKGHTRFKLPSTEQCDDKPCGPEKFSCSNGCCIDKAQECDHEKQCSDGSDEEKCDSLRNAVQELLDLPVDVDKAHCTQSPVTGPCRASFTLWYYNPFDKKCKPFNYGGCNGNENRFENERSCMNTCKDVSTNDVFTSRKAFEKQTEDRNLASIGIAVVLVLAILVLLALLAYCVLKGKKQKRSKNQHITANGSYQYPVEDREKLVYNSTTKPI